MLNFMHRIAGGRLLAAIAVIAMTLGGLFAFRSLPVDAFPDPSPALVQVFTETEGLSPEEVERYVTFPIETAMSGLPKVREMRSTSNFGLSVVNIYFEDGTDVYFARQVVGERLGEAADAIPAGFGTPKMGPISTGLGIIMYFRLVDETGTRSLIELREIADWMIKYPLQSVEGVTEVLALGGFEKQYQVQLDPDALLAQDLQVSDVIAALESANRTAGAQYIEIGAEQYTVRGVGLATTIADLEETPVRAIDGRTIRVGDLGQVVIGGAVRQGMATANGEGETVAGLVLKLYGSNTSDVIANAKVRFEEINASLPDGVRVIPYYDQGTLVEKAAATVTTALWQGGLLVAIVVFLFLGGWRPSLVVVMSIPFSVGFAFIAMNALGIGANLMTLGGVAIAIGMMVDGAIVIAENVTRGFRERGAGEDNRTTVARSSAEVIAPLVAAVAVVIIVFLPLFSLQGTEGKTFRPLAASAALAMTAVGIADFATRPYRHLSGGEKQRVALAMALAQEPTVLLLDEPTHNLDLAQQNAFFTVLRRLTEERSLSVLAVIHDVNLASLHCDRLLMLQGGGIIAGGTPAAVLTEANLRRCYGVDARIMPHPDNARPQVFLAQR